MSCWSTRLFPAHCGCCTGEHDGVGVSRHLKTVSGSGRKFREVKQERNGSEKNLPIPPWGLKEKEKDVSALTVLQLPVPKKKKNKNQVKDLAYIAKYSCLSNGHSYIAAVYCSCFAKVLADVILYFQECV